METIVGKPLELKNFIEYQKDSVVSREIIRKDNAECIVANSVMQQRVILD